MNLNLFPISHSNHEKSLLSTLSLTFDYKGDIGINNGFKLYIKKCKEENSSYYFIVSPVGIVNPRTKAREIYHTVVNIAENLQISWNNITIFLDLLEFSGIEKKHIFKWVFSEKNNKIQDEIKEISHSSDDWINVLSAYYNEKFSALTNSSLNNKQKVEISAYALAENCYDEFSAENIAKIFRTILKNAVNRKKTLKSTLSKLL
jgi:hypothetical protein